MDDKHRSADVSRWLPLRRQCNHERRSDQMPAFGAYRRREQARNRLARRPVRNAGGSSGRRSSHRPLLQRNAAPSGSLCSFSIALGCERSVVIATRVTHRGAQHRDPQPRLPRGRQSLPRAVPAAQPSVVALRLIAINLRQDSTQTIRPRLPVLKEKPGLSRAFLTSGRQDLNLRPPGPQPGALPDCATPRGQSIITVRGGGAPPGPRPVDVAPVGPIRRAGDGNRTRPRSLEGFCATTTLRPQVATMVAGAPGLSRPAGAPRSAPRRRWQGPQAARARTSCRAHRRA